MNKYNSKYRNRLNKNMLSNISDIINDVQGTDTWGIEQKSVKSRSQRIKDFQRKLRNKK